MGYVILWQYEEDVICSLVVMDPPGVLTVQCKHFLSTKQHRLRNEKLRILGPTLKLFLYQSVFAPQNGRGTDSYREFEPRQGEPTQTNTDC